MSLQKKIAAAVVAAICLIACIAVSYMAGYARGAARRTTLSSTEGTSGEVDAENVSEDDIKPLEEDTISVLCCGVDNTQELTDVIMYALFNTKTGEVNVLRIPRDTFVGSEFPTGKINAIYGHPEDGLTGIETLEKYLEENWKLNIDYYATIDLASVRDIVDDMGGVTMNIEQQINYLPGKVLYPGEQTLTGEQAEWIIRYRAGYADGDLGRIDAQTQFIFACIDRVHELGRLKCIPILMEHYNDVDTNMPLDKMLSVASALFELSTDDIQMHVVPGSGTMYYSYAVYGVDEEALLEILNENFATQGSQYTAEDLNIAFAQAVPPMAATTATAAATMETAAIITEKATAITTATGKKPSSRRRSRTASGLRNISTTKTETRCTAWTRTVIRSTTMMKTAISFISISKPNSRSRNRRRRMSRARPSRKMRTATASSFPNPTAKRRNRKARSSRTRRAAPDLENNS